MAGAENGRGDFGLELVHKRINAEGPVLSVHLQAVVGNGENEVGVEVRPFDIGMPVPTVRASSLFVSPQGARSDLWHDMSDVPVGITWDSSSLPGPVRQPQRPLPQHELQPGTSMELSVRTSEVAPDGRIRPGSALYGPADRRGGEPGRHVPVLGFALDKGVLEVSYLPRTTDEEAAARLPGVVVSHYVYTHGLRAV